MRPLDPRLLRSAAAARTFFGVGVVLGIVRTTATLAFCFVLSQAIVGAIFGRSFSELLPDIMTLAGVGILRAATIWAMDVASARGAAVVKSQLRRRIIAGLACLGPGWLLFAHSPEAHSHRDRNSDPDRRNLPPGPDQRCPRGPRVAADPDLHDLDRPCDPGGTEAAIASAGAVVEPVSRCGRQTRQSRDFRPTASRR